MAAVPLSLPTDPPRPTRFLLLFALAYAGAVIGYLPLFTLLLPARIAEIAGETRLDLFTATVIAGATAASLSNLLFGWLSDRSLARGGGRRGWVALGMAMTVVAYAAIALAHSPATIVLAVTALQVAVNALLAPLIAIMADEVPDAQKGVAGGSLAFASPLASAVCAVLVGLPALGDAARFAIVPALLLVCIAPLLFTPALPVMEQAVGAARTMQSRRDLAIAWAARLLIQVSGAVLSLYLLYFFESVPPGARPELASRVAQVLTLAYVISLPVAVLAGRISDRIGRRKPFLLGAAALAAAGLIGMAGARDFTNASLCFGLFSIASAVFLALHSAFATQLLPNPRHRGRDLGLLNLTNTLPALLGPILAWTLATPDDFGAVMLALAALAICGGLLILAIRE